jgi:translation elongation factor EF-1beta
MKKLIFLIILMCLVFGLFVGCGPSYDKEGFAYIRQYADDIIPVIDVALYNFISWTENVNNEKLLQNIKDSADEIAKINSQYWTDEFPDDRDIEKWKINMSRGNEEWVVEGEELADAIWDVEFNSEWLSEALKEVYEAGGDLAKIRTEWVGQGISAAKSSMEQLRWTLYRQ